jgi:hypothetical protein
MNLTTLGLIFTAVGALILMLNNIITGWHQRVYGQPPNKKYWWMGRKPFYKNTQTLKWHFKWNHIVPVEGFLPPKYILEIIGFFFILVGTILQIIRIY